MERPDGRGSDTESGSEKDREEKPASEEGTGGEGEHGGGEAADGRPLAEKEVLHAQPAEGHAQRDAGDAGVVPAEGGRVQAEKDDDATKSPHLGSSSAPPETSADSAESVPRKYGGAYCCLVNSNSITFPHFPTRGDRRRKKKDGPFSGKSKSKYFKASVINSS